MRFISWASALGFRLVGAGFVIALAVVYVGFSGLVQLKLEDRIFLATVGKVVFLAGIVCLWLAGIIADLRPKNAG